MLFKYLKQSIELHGNASTGHVETQASHCSAPVVTYLTDVRKWRLEQTYTCRNNGNLIKVPSQFEFDLASIPRPFWWLIAPFELSLAAPLVHDFLYRYQGDPPHGSIVPPRIYTRRQADLLFRAIMKKEGVWWWRRTASYLAVRLFGWNAWSKK